MNTKKFISIIIPNLNSPIIDQTIDSLLSQDTHFLFEIIIVGQDKYGIVEKNTDDRIIFIKTEKPTPPSIARNLGVASSKGDYFIFIDADCIAAPNFIDGHMRAHTEIENGLCGGAVSIREDHDYWILCDNIATFHETLSHTKSGFREILPSLNLSLPRNLWQSLGGFNSTITVAGEDADLSYRARAINASLYFTPDAEIFHRHLRKSFKTTMKHAYQFGQYSIKFNPNYENSSKIAAALIKYPWLIIIFSPIIACSVVLKIVFGEKLPLKYWHTLPIVNLAKMAWCFGASKRLMRTKKSKIKNAKQR